MITTPLFSNLEDDLNGEEMDSRNQNTEDQSGLSFIKNLSKS